MPRQEKVTYTNNGTVGEDSFTYQVFHNEDSSVVSNVATVQLDIRERYAAPSNPVNNLQFAQGTGSVALSWSANAGAQAPRDI